MMKRLLCFSLIILLVCVLGTPAASTAPGEPIQLKGVIDIRSHFSDGSYSIEELVKKAAARGISVVVVNDHDSVILSYGLPPFPNILRKKEELNSILKNGPRQYLKAVKEAAERHPETIVIPGTESSPFYYWSGNPLGGTLTAHNHERRLLTVGLEKAEDYQHLPLPHRLGPPNPRLVPSSVLFLLALLCALAMTFMKGRTRPAGAILAVIALLFLVDNHPFRTSAYDPFHGDQGYAPYQDLIDYVNQRGGMTFWNYPETQSGVRRLGPIMVSTRPYPEALLETKGYTGFAALYGDNITVTDPGGVWDATLKEYLKGYRTWPPWGIATADYHREGESGEILGNYQTVFLVTEKTKAAVLKAMQTGRMYAVQGPYPVIPVLEEFSVSTPDGRKKVWSGEELILKDNPVVRVRLSLPPDGEGKTPTGNLKVRLIRQGEVVFTHEGPPPVDLSYEDTSLKPGERVFYRMDMKGVGTIVSNPIFVTRQR